MTDERLLTDIFKAYYDARRNKRNSRSQLHFEMRLEENLIALYHEIAERRYRVGRSMCFITEVPVKREIFAADFRDRVVHHLLYNYIAPMLERSFIDDSYSCRKEKGTLYGIQRMESHIRSCSDNFRKPCYLLKLDIRGYFMNIDRNKLYEILCRRFDRYARRPATDGKTWDQLLDYDLIRYLTHEIVFNDPTDDCCFLGDRNLWQGLPRSKSLFCTPTGCGLPIGNLTSQLFSNVYLDEFDQFVKRELRCRHYGRYVDDFYIVHPDRNYLRTLVPRLRDFLESELHLMLHPNKIVLQYYSKGAMFLGACIKPHRRYPARRTVELFRRAIRRLEAECRRTELSEVRRARMLSVINSYCGYLHHFKAYGILDRQFRDSPLGRYFRFSKNYRKARISRGGSPGMRGVAQDVAQDVAPGVSPGVRGVVPGVSSGVAPGSGSLEAVARGVSRGVSPGVAGTVSGDVLRGVLRRGSPEVLRGGPSGVLRGVLRGESSGVLRGPRDMETGLAVVRDISPGAGSIAGWPRGAPGLRGLAELAGLSGLAGRIGYEAA